MRVAAFNVENLFDRAKVFNSPDPNEHRDVLDAHAELNKLFQLMLYSPTDKSRMLELMGQLGVLTSDDGEMVLIRRIRGQLIRRPQTGLPEIVASGRLDWVGWCELKTGPVNEIAIENTGRVMRDVDADILAVVEAESRPVLKAMNDMVLAEVGGLPYPNLMIIDGNDERGIDVGIMTKSGYDIGLMRSHVHEQNGDGNRVFSRDCPEYQILTPSGETIWVLPNHFKSKFGGDDPVSRARREKQSQAVARYYNRLISEGIQNIIILGDFNDTPTSAPLQSLLQTNLKDISEHPSFTDFQFRANNGNRGIGTYGLGNDNSKIDYLLLSPALFQRVTNGGIFRKGAWPGTRVKRWDTYPELVREVHAASDHHAIFADIDI